MAAPFVFLKLKIDFKGESPISPDDFIAPTVRVRYLRHAGGRWGTSQVEPSRYRREGLHHLFPVVFVSVRAVRVTRRLFGRQRSPSAEWRQPESSSPSVSSTKI